MGHQLVLCLIMLLLFAHLTIKWKQVLMLMISLEGLTAAVLTMIIMSSGNNFMINILFFTFFVSEALILLVSLFYSLKMTGMSFSKSLIY